MRQALIDEYPELRDTLAELFVDGKTQQEIADAMSVKDRGTVAVWLKRADIQARISKLIQERANSMLSKTDAKIMGYLTGSSKISLENLLKIRRELAGTLIKVDTGTDPAAALAELWKLADADPEIASALEKIGVQQTQESEAENAELAEEA